jgi:hypothetical protein
MTQWPADTKWTTHEPCLFSEFVMPAAMSAAGK